MYKGSFRKRVLEIPVKVTRGCVHHYYQILKYHPYLHFVDMDMQRTIWVKRTAL